VPRAAANANARFKRKLRRKGEGVELSMEPCVIDFSNPDDERLSRVASNTSFVSITTKAQLDSKTESLA
jgi:hypothetical protein